MKKQIKIISGDELVSFEKTCNEVLGSLPQSDIIQTELIVVAQVGFYLKIEYYG